MAPEELWETDAGTCEYADADDNKVWFYRVARFLPNRESVLALGVRVADAGLDNRRGGTLKYSGQDTCSTKITAIEKAIRDVEQARMALGLPKSREVQMFTVVYYS